MESRVEKAQRLFKEGYNCSQAIVGAFCDVYDMDLELALRVSAAFGAGMGRMREVCGAVSGMAIIAGLENGTVDGTDVEGKKSNYDLIVKLASAFKEKNGSIICRELLGLEKKLDDKIDTRPAERNEQYYKSRPCLEKVKDCAEIIEEIIMKSK